MQPRWGLSARYMTRPPITPERMLGEVDKDQIISRKARELVCPAPPLAGSEPRNSA